MRLRKHYIRDNGEDLNPAIRSDNINLKYDNTL